MLLRPHLTSNADREKLIEAIDAGLDQWGAYASNLDRFRREIRQSRAVPPTDVPADMVTMNSRFVLRNLHTGESICYTLVYPNEEAVHEGRISVLSAMGMAILGAREGDRVTWIAASVPAAGCIERILYQPARAVARRAERLPRSL